MGKYYDELQKSMTYLGQQEDTVFLGQAVEYKGTGMTNTLKNVPREKLIEMPVNEEMQMGITNGLAIGGLVPISIYPRWNFLILAANQLVNHLDKYSIYTDGQYAPKAIVRVGVGSIRPLNPQIQHTGDFTEGFKHMLETIDVIELREPEDILPAYKKAYSRTDGKSTILVEWGDFYNEK